MRVVFGDDTFGRGKWNTVIRARFEGADRLQFFVLRCRVDDERREKLFQHVAVLLEQ